MFDNEEQTALREAVQKFVERELPPGFARRCDAEQSPPLEQYRRLAEAGYLGIGLPEEYGGFGGTAVDLSIVLEELAYGMVSFAQMVYRSAIHGSHAILRYGTEEQKRDLIPRIVRGELLCSLSLTEPEAGSDAANVRTRAVRDGDDYVINGQKMYSSAAHLVDRILLVARTSEGARRHDGLTLFLVDPKNTPGITIQRIPTLGERAVGTNMVFYDDVRIPAGNVLGAVDGGWLNLMGNLDRERLSIGCFSLGGARAVRDGAVGYASGRVQFGKPIGSFQVTQHKLANMEIDIHAAKLIVRDLAEQIDAGRSARKAASICKVFCAEMYNRVAYEGMQIHGGIGYTMDSDMQLHMRDARLLTIGGGSSEVMRNVIAREVQA